jgi:hypothetical protein
MYCGDQIMLEAGKECLAYECRPLLRDNRRLRCDVDEIGLSYPAPCVRLVVASKN